jgi:hypothetical protein
MKHLTLREFILTDLAENGPTTVTLIASAAKSAGIIYAGTPRIAYSMTYATLCDLVKRGLVLKQLNSYSLRNT